VRIFTAFYNPPEAEMAQWLSDKEEHNQMLKLYRKQDWNKALKVVESLKGKFNGQMDHYYEHWIERIHDMAKSTLPRDWDGVYRATSK
jgi:hypothetical protein